MTESTVAAREKEMLAEINSLDDWKERYGYIIDLGADLEPLPEDCRRDEFKVRGCTSQVWAAATLRDGKVFYLADSDSLFVKGLAGLLVKLFSGARPHEIVNHTGNILMESGLVQNLSPNRVNGAAALFARMKELATAFA